MTDESANTESATGELGEITHDEQQRRFEFTRDGVELAHLEYVPRAGSDGQASWAFTHTWTEPAARGQGLAAKVTVGALEAARAAGVKVIPICPYVASFLAVHDEYSDLDPAGRGE